MKYVCDKGFVRAFTLCLGVVGRMRCLTRIQAASIHSQRLGYHTTVCKGQYSTRAHSRLLGPCYKTGGERSHPLRTLSTIQVFAKRTGEAGNVSQVALSPLLPPTGITRIPRSVQEKKGTRNESHRNGRDASQTTSHLIGMVKPSGSKVTEVLVDPCEFALGT